jgi:hypothetical protein
MSVMILQLAQAHKAEHPVVSGVPETMAARSLIVGLIQPYASTQRFKPDIKMGLQPARLARLAYLARLARLAAGQICAALRCSAADSVVTFEASLPC